MTRVNLIDARCEALFASTLQRSEAPSVQAVVTAIVGAVRRYGIRGCAARMAQEFGDHPEAAAERMRWVRQAVGAAFPGPVHEPAPAVNHPLLRAA